MAEQDRRSTADAEQKHEFRKNASDKNFGDTARMARSFARPQKPVTMRPVSEPAGAAKNESRPAAPEAVKPYKPLREPSAPPVPEDGTRRVKPVSETRPPADGTKRLTTVHQGQPQAPAAGRPAAPGGETKRQDAVKPPEEVSRVKVASDAKVPFRPRKQDTQGVRIAARNRQAAEMETIFKREARMTELPGSRSYFSYIFRLKRNGPSKVYRLKGYCNREYVKKKRRAERRHIRRANTAFWIVVILLFLVVFYWLDPIDKIQHMLRLFGM